MFTAWYAVYRAPHADFCSVVCKLCSSLCEVGKLCVELLVWHRGCDFIRSSALRQKRILQGHGDDITGLSFSPDSAIVVSSSRDCSLRVWQVATGEHAGPPLALSTSLMIYL